MKLTTSSSFVVFTLLCLVLSSCVENIVRIDIHPRGDYTVTFTARGDSTDLYNDDFVIPLGPPWKTEQFVEKDEDDEKHVAKSFRHLPRGKKLPSNYSSDNFPRSIKLHHPLAVEMEDRFFWRRYRFNYTFRGRHVDEKYPTVRQLLNDDEAAGEEQEIVHYIAHEGLDRARETAPGTVSVAMVEQIGASINSIVAALTESDEGDEVTDWMENKGDWISDLTEGINPAPPQEFLDRWEYHMDILEKELMITTDLNDDSFKVFTTLPGNLVSGNYDTLYGDTLGWEFSLEDFVEDDFVMTAESLLEMPQRRRSLIVLAVTALVIVAALEGNRRNKKRQSTPL